MCVPIKISTDVFIHFIVIMASSSGLGVSISLLSLVRLTYMCLSGLSEEIRRVLQGFSVKDLPRPTQIIEVFSFF
jgi:hypothetical protein